MNNIIAPSILSADFSNLEHSIKLVEDAGADWLHIDVMDGHFVPNITIGAPVVKSIRKVTKIPFDVHLMIENPDKYLNDFINAGADIITVHYEACSNNIEEVIEKIRVHNIKAGVSIKPKTPVQVLENIITKLDLVLIMTVEPGFGGQAFMNECVKKIEQLKELLQKYQLTEVMIEVDGGINQETAKIVKNAGANVLVAGSYIYNSNNISETIRTLRL